MDHLHGFTLLFERQLPELNSYVRFLRHRQTGAELLSLENTDENKVFGVTFCTPPTSSNGVAHIMEHSVLCGSRKYPVKEPFVELMKGSLNTFLNAMTYPDKTCYPVASQNLQDFYNLIDVYLDAVFYPLIPPYVLQQEGWHYELTQPGDPLSYKGVVFNEMKGSLSDPDSILMDAVQRSLFPDTPYAVNAGGDPRVIPELTYQDFKDFHARYYHPSNARIYFYGDDAPEERLRLMDAWLSSFQAAPVDVHLPLQQPFAEPRCVSAAFDPGGDPDNNKGRLVVNWLLPGTQDPAKRLAFHILTHILLGSPAAPLRKALIDSGLGEDLAGVGLESDLKQAYLSTGLQGITIDPQQPLGAGHPVETLIVDTLRRLVKEGIQPEQVAASMNTVEFHLREFNFGSAPRGLVAMLLSLNSWLYGGDPLAPLAFTAPLQALKDRLHQGERVFETLIQDALLDNPHRTTVALAPEPGLNARLDAEERLRLEKAQAGMSQADAQRIMEDTLRLQQRQVTPDSPEALATIPTLALADLDRQARRIPLAAATQHDCQLISHDLFTNGIVYQDVGLDLHRLPQDLLPYMPLFGRSLLETGAGEQDFVRLLQRIGSSTGGIHPTMLVTQKYRRPGSQAWLMLRAKATLAQLDDLLAILGEVLLSARLDNRARIRQIVLEQKASLEAELAPMGHRIVDSRLRARCSEAGWVVEQFGGVEQLLFLRGLVDDVEQRWPQVQTRLERIRNLLVKRAHILVNLTLDQAHTDQIMPRLEAFLAGLPEGKTRRAAWHWQSAGRGNDGLAIPSQVNYVAKGGSLPDLGYTPTGAMDVITNFLSTTYLWEHVRVQGGAYGGFCQFSPYSGVFTYVSYRDPNLVKTLDTYDGAARFLQQLDIHPDELPRAIIGAIGDLDRYQLPDAKGYTALIWWLAGESDKLRQQWREQVLGARPQDFRDFGAVLEKLNVAGQIAAMGSPEALHKANQERPGLLTIHKVL